MTTQQEERFQMALRTEIENRLNILDYFFLNPSSNRDFFNERVQVEIVMLLALLEESDEPNAQIMINRIEDFKGIDYEESCEEMHGKIAEFRAAWAGDWGSFDVDQESFQWHMN